MGRIFQDANIDAGTRGAEGNMEAIATVILVQRLGGLDLVHDNKAAWLLTTLKFDET